MTIIIPSGVLIAALVIVVWFALGVVFNHLVLTKVKRRYMDRRRHQVGSIVPRRFERLAFAIAGPIAWVIYAYETLRSRRIAKRNDAQRARDMQLYPDAW